ncbi:MAG: DUF1254 domain-containing protein [Hyphomonadaceae bacterium]|nr:DUF1254 domain-containing protein [Hyphomonadaceae bacterium]
MNRREFAAGAGALALAGCAASTSTAASSLLPAPPPRIDPATHAEEAFLYGFAPFEMARVAGGAFTQGAPPNRFAHRATLSDHTARAVTTPNNDTLYSPAFVDLTGGPVELVTPTLTDRYWSVAMMSAFTDNFRVLGTRTTKGAGGRYWLVGPQWRGRAPEGVEVVRAPTADIWVLGRILVDGAYDLAAAAAVQRQFTMQPVGGGASPRRFRAADPLDSENFFGVLDETLTRSGAAPSGLQSPGLTDGDAWRREAAATLAKLRSGLGRKGRLISGWTYPADNLGDFGDDHAFRAQVALSGLGALPKAEAIYLSGVVDATGALLNGANAYRFSLPPGGAPVDAFWSLSMYEVDAEGRLYFIDNPIQRYAIGNRTQGLLVAADGSLEVIISADRPANASNWLPAPRKPFRVTFRGYLPQAPLLSGAWTLPAITRV